MNQKEKNIKKIVTPIIKKEGYEVLGVKIRFKRERKAIIVTIDKKGGVTIGDCEKVSNLINPVLEKEDPIKESYSIIVSSPGKDL
ncbi:MAG: ribosome maturation factor RimP [Minisyncoccales bacterium]